MDSLINPNLIATGVDGLDEVLLGGIPKFNNVLVEGAPGAGKTTLGLQFIYKGIVQLDEPGLIVTFEMEPHKVLRDAAGFSWDLQALVEAGQLKIIQSTPEVLLAELRKPSGVLFEEVANLGAKRLLIDGLTPLKIFAQRTDRSIREELYLMVEALTRLGVTTMMTAERADIASSEAIDERFVFDTVISIGRIARRKTVNRTIQVSKSRGQRFSEGIHSMRIESEIGVKVYPRAYSRPQNLENQPTSSARLSTGIPKLDVIMNGGVYEGSITMLSGISGTGKTVAGVQFLVNSIHEGRKGLLVTLDEHPRQLIRNAATLDLNLQPAIDDGNLFILYESPLELETDVHYANVINLIEREKIDVVVFDSAAAYETANVSEVVEFLYALADYLKQNLITTYLSYESPELLGISQISEALKASHLVDNIILLNYVEISTKLRRAIVVPKVRGSRNIQETREYVIKSGGIEILDKATVDGALVTEVPQLPFSAYYGLLSRSPSRRSPVIDEAIESGQPIDEQARAGKSR